MVQLDCCNEFKSLSFPSLSPSLSTFQPAGKCEHVLIFPILACVSHVSSLLRTTSGHLSDWKPKLSRKTETISPFFLSAAWKMFRRRRLVEVEVFYRREFAWNGCWVVNVELKGIRKKRRIFTPLNSATKRKGGCTFRRNFFHLGWGEWREVSNLFGWWMNKIWTCLSEEFSCWIVPFSK